MLNDPYSTPQRQQLLGARAHKPIKQDTQTATHGRQSGQTGNGAVVTSLLKGSGLLFTRGLITWARVNGSAGLQRISSASGGGLTLGRGRVRTFQFFRVNTWAQLSVTVSRL